ncbi:SgcJ/EcaC family oxidoreductase [Neisseria zalophi]|uniref:SgcJ/EcaC family oxidoreductase n=1 Tax=Neisseria zalophi TaxID=640030 RepID=A0A5J6PTU6_9NEIS|nr:SgcJ/EcaC family oxidoreductase [Neisseria zalophi]QEY26069.1 SgcJ/EcaC family oxidoreductase [Neisseria zalophi]
MKLNLLSMLVLSTLLTACASTAEQGSQTMAANACKVTNKQEIASLFNRWNNALQTGDPKQVVSNYAPGSILLPTLSNKPRLTVAEKEDYFVHFLEKKPVGTINMSHIQLGCNTAIDNGLYTFKYANGSEDAGRYTFTYTWDGQQWLISSHHSSLMPEK